MPPPFLKSVLPHIHPREAALRRGPRGLPGRSVTSLPAIHRGHKYMQACLVPFAILTSIHVKQTFVVDLAASPAAQSRRSQPSSRTQRNTSIPYVPAGRLVCFTWIVFFDQLRINPVQFLLWAGIPSSSHPRSSVLLYGPGFSFGPLPDINGSRRPRQISDTALSIGGQLILADD